MNDINLWVRPEANGDVFVFLVYGAVYYIPFGVVTVEQLIELASANHRRRQLEGRL